MRRMSREELNNFLAKCLCLGASGVMLGAIVLVGIAFSGSEYSDAYVQPICGDLLRERGCTFTQRYWRYDCPNDSPSLTMAEDCWHLIVNRAASIAFPSGVGLALFMIGIMAISRFFCCPPTGDRGSDVEQGERTRLISNPSESSLLEKRLEKIGFPTNLIPQKFLCSITLSLINEPVFLNGNVAHTFEKQAIEAWKARQDTHPHTREPIRSIEANQTLRQEIESWLIGLEEKAKSQFSEAMTREDKTAYWQGEYPSHQDDASCSPDLSRRP